MSSRAVLAREALAAVMRKQSLLAKFADGVWHNCEVRSVGVLCLRPACFNTVLDERSDHPDNRDNRPQYLRGMRSVVKYTNVCLRYLGTVRLRFSTLEVARKVRGEACGYLLGDPVPLQKHVAGGSGSPT